MSANNKKVKAKENTIDDFFETNEEPKKLATHIPQAKDNVDISRKNVIFKYKDGTSTTVCYDGSSKEYIEVKMN